MQRALTMWLLVHVFFGEHRKVWTVTELVTDDARPRYRPGRGTKLALTAPCLYPGCGNTVTLRPRGGLPTQFCSDDCRSNYRNIGRQLQRTLELLEAAEDDEAGVGEERQEALRLVEWHLVRFRAGVRE